MIDRTQATEAESIALRFELAEQRNRVTFVQGRHTALKNTVTNEQKRIDELELDLTNLREKSLNPSTNNDKICQKICDNI